MWPSNSLQQMKMWRVNRFFYWQFLVLISDTGRVTTRNSHIIWDFSYKFIKKICKKILFFYNFSKNVNWQIIPSWVIISYKIIKFASISYKICCEKCFIQNILQKKIGNNFLQFFFSKQNWQEIWVFLLVSWTNNISHPLF